MKLVASWSVFCMLIIASVNASLPDTTATEKDVLLHTASGDLAGTLTLPDMANPVVVLFIAGSGPTDRNGNGPGFQNNSYAQLGHALALKGIASLRFDKRGVGGSQAAGVTEAELRFDTYVADATGWIQQLKKDHRFSRIVVIGHSEGALIGLLASRTNVDRYVSIAGPGQSIDKTIRAQLSRQPQAIQAIADPVLDSLRQGKTVASVDPSLYALFRPSVQPYMISWMKYDPAKEITQEKIPVLIIQGTADLQISAADAQALKNADPAATLVLVDHMNHMLKTVSDDPQANLAAYNDPSLPVSDQLVQSIVKFINTIAASK